MSLRKAQLQALEPIMITIILVVIAGVGLLFYVKINSSQSAGDRASFSQEEDLAMLSKLASMPELSCPAGAGLPKNCIDFEKAKAFQHLLAVDERARQYYFPMLGATNITLESVNLTAGQVERIVLYANAHTDSVTITTTYFASYNPMKQTTQFTTLIIERER